MAAQQKKKILIAHGWMHSAMRYRQFKEDLEQHCPCRIKLYEFPGFGDTPARYKKNILDHYEADMRQYLAGHDFDGIIAHSMGANIALKAALGTTNLLLLSPVYNGLAYLKPLTVFYPFAPSLIRVLQSPFTGCRYLIRLCSLPTVNHFAAMDRQLIEDVRKADPQTAARVLSELIYDHKRVQPTPGRSRVSLLLGQKDRVIPPKSVAMLKNDLGGCPAAVLSGTGHTPVLENYKELRETVTDWIISLPSPKTKNP